MIIPDQFVRLRTSNASLWDCQTTTIKSPRLVLLSEKTGTTPATVI